LVLQLVRSSSRKC